jgi:acetylornithine deacetylase/succinyl-diaminopimelate desuccinylase-like protein
MKEQPTMTHRSAQARTSDSTMAGPAPGFPSEQRSAEVDPTSSFLEGSARSMLEQLGEWVRIPSVAADPERAGDVARSARWLADRFEELGMTAAVYPTGDTAAVLAEWIVDESLPTVLVYSHHDVRDAKPDQWEATSPYEPFIRDGRLYGRGASDAKGQVIAHLWGLRAHLAASGGDRPAVNLKFLVEGEEESGSPHLEELLEEHKEQLACDVIVFSDTIQWSTDDPGVVTSMRGILTASLTIRGPQRDVHSGIASGAAPNPAHVLADVLSALHDQDDRIALPGFYDDVEPLTEDRQAELDDVPYDENRWLTRTETRSTSGETGYTVKERLWARPSLEVLSLLAGDPEGIPRAVIPATAEAMLNIRTVPNQRVEVVAEQLRRFVAELVPDSVAYTLQVDVESGQDPYVSPRAAAFDALQRSIAAGFGRTEVSRVGNAGGGPADLLVRVFDAPILFLGTGLPEDHWHASDESIDIGMLRGGAAAIAHLWAELGELGRGRLADR